MLISLITVTATFVISTGLFYRAAGTLNPCKINMVSMFYYLFMLQMFIGTSMTMLGFDGHYTLSSVVNRQNIVVTARVVMVTAIVMPLIILFVQRIAKVKARCGFFEYLQTPVEKDLIAEKQIFSIILAISLICIALLIALFIKIGYYPLTTIFSAPPGFNFRLERMRIARTYVLSPYIMNLGPKMFIPLCAFISFSYALAIKNLRWISLAVATFVALVSVSTYNFEKSPVVLSLTVYVLILMYNLKNGIPMWLAAVALIAAGSILVIFYSSIAAPPPSEDIVYNPLAEEEDTFKIDIYSGIIGRTIYSPFGVLCWHFDLFSRNSNNFDFLNGRSLSPSILRITGGDPSLHLRSGEIVMGYYGSMHKYAGTAGVASAFFIGESYANWSWPGVAFSVVWVSFLIALVLTAMLKIKKHPITVALFSFLAYRLTFTSFGGFVDFLYNAALIITILFFVGLLYYPALLTKVMAKLKEKALD